jgi:hypothetical protein
MSTKERRKYARYKKRTTVRYGESELDRSGFTHDMSARGMFILAQQLPPLDQRLHLQVFVDTTRALYFEAVVRRHRVAPPAMRQTAPSGFGVRLLDPEEVMGELFPASPKSGGSVPSGPPRITVSFATREALETAHKSELRAGIVSAVYDAPVKHNDVATVIFDCPFAKRSFELAGHVVFVQSGEEGARVAVQIDDREKLEAELRSVFTSA